MEHILNQKISITNAATPITSGQQYFLKLAGRQRHAGCAAEGKLIGRLLTFTGFYSYISIYGSLDLFKNKLDSPWSYNLIFTSHHRFPVGAFMGYLNKTCRASGPVLRAASAGKTWTKFTITKTGKNAQGQDLVELKTYYPKSTRKPR